MLMPERAAIGYVVKRYPRYSETFIVNEILAHEDAGLPVEIFSLRPPCDTHFQEEIGRVRAPVTYLPADNVRSTDFWCGLREAARRLPGLWPALADAPDTDARDIWQATVLARHVVARGVRHLHAHFASASSTVALLAGRIAGVSFSFTAHAKDIFGPEVSSDDVRLKLAHATATITVSDHNVEYLRHTYGEVAGRVLRIYNGLPLQQFPFRSPGDRPPVIVGVGRLVEKKGFGDLIDACAVLRATGRAFSCRVIGAGPLEGALREQIGRLGLESHVALLGPQPRTDVVRHVHDAAVLAAPCLVSSDGDRDGLPTVLIEAMALGTPCVSSKVTGIPEIVRDGLTGLLVPERDARQLAAVLGRLLDDAALRVHLAAAARALVERAFDVRRNAGAVREVFSAAMAAGARAEVA